MTEKIVILGAGIAGCIAYHALRDRKPVIVEAKPKVAKFETHDALMRLRDDEVARFIGAESEKIEIQKAVFYQDKFETPPSILSNNLYSIKLYNELGKRSILKPGVQERYILPSGYPVPENIMWDKKVEWIEPGLMKFTDGDELKYDYCISTIPMPIMHGYITVPRSKQKIGFECVPVYVKRLNLKIPSDVNQTVYFPDPKISIYRITIQDQIAIVEGIDSPEDFEIEDLMDSAFGIIPTEYGIPTQCTILPMGKIRSIDEDERLRFILWLTDNFNVFSFGRYSVWKPLRTDELMDDIWKVKRIITAKGIEGDYKNRLR